MYFVAAGLMGDLDMEPSFHQQVAYKASWHQIGDDAEQFAEMPPGSLDAPGYGATVTSSTRAQVSPFTHRPA